MSVLGYLSTLFVWLSWHQQKAISEAKQIIINNTLIIKDIIIIFNTVY